MPIAGTLQAKTGRSSQPTHGCECLGCAHDRPAVSPAGMPILGSAELGAAPQAPPSYWGCAGGGLGSCTALHVFKRVFALASASSRHRRAHLCRLLAVALVSFDLGFFHWFFYNRKKKSFRKGISV